MSEHKVDFNGLGIAPGILTTVAGLGITAPTPIQLKAIPPAIEGKDVVGIAQTGTGKTLAFGIPLAQHLASLHGKGLGLILVPTRELALQVEEQIHKIARPLGLRSTVLIGGTSMVPQLRALRNNPNIIIATPGRLIDHLEQRTLSLGSAKIVVLDEADRMLDMGFWPQIKKIIAALPHERQTMLFSATLSPEIMQLASQHMKLPTRIEVAPSGTTAEKVSQEFFIVRKEDKVRLLEKILSERKGSTIVFSRTKHGATKITRVLKRMGHSAAEIHSNRSLNQRKDALEGFKIGRYRVLVATDIAARGIDVKGIELVLNYDLPQASEDYVHRIGRTARAGAEGHAISFAEPNQRREMAAIERLIRKAIPVSKLPSDLPEARPQEAFIQDDRPRQFGNRNFSRSSRPGQSRSFGGGSQQRLSAIDRPRARNPYSQPRPGGYTSPAPASASSSPTPAFVVGGQSGHQSRPYVSQSNFRPRRPYQGQGSRPGGSSSGGRSSFGGSGGSRPQRRYGGNRNSA